MKLTARTGVMLLFAVLLIAAGILYWMFSGAVEERDRIRADRDLAETMVGALEAQKASAEEELGELEDEYEALNEKLDDLKISLNLAEEDLLDSQARLELAVDSIEYGEVLFQLAGVAGVDISSIDVAPPSAQTLDGIEYDVTRINLDIKGSNREIFDMIDIIALHEKFRTSTASPVNINIPPPPEPVEIDEEAIFEKHYQALLEKNLEKITPEETAEIVKDVAFEFFDMVITESPEKERIEFIYSKVNQLVNDELSRLIAEGIADYTQQQIASLLAGKIADYWADEVSGLLDDEVEEILGGNMADWLEDEIAGGIPGEISAIINEYISEKVDERINFKAEPSQSEVEALAQEEIEKLKQQADRPSISSTSITLEIFSYQRGN